MCIDGSVRRRNIITVSSFLPHRLHLFCAHIFMTAFALPNYQNSLFFKLKILMLPNLFIKNKKKRDLLDQAWAHFLTRWPQWLLKFDVGGRVMCRDVN